MPHSRAALLALTLVVLSFAPPPAGAERAPARRPWLDASLPPDRRADLVLEAMTPAEKLSLVFGYFGSVMPGAHYSPPQARARIRSAAAGLVACGALAAATGREGGATASAI